MYYSPVPKAPTSQAKARQFATQAHEGQLRTSGEPFITHLAAVVELLKGIGADEETLTAAWLHDVLEDTEITAKELRKEFGLTVTTLVEGVTKVEQLEKTFDKRVRNMESIRKMFRTMGHDIRVLFIKLTDRLHNMRTIGHVPEEKQVRIAQETMDIYCPLARLLGIRGWYEELADHCFGILDPLEHSSVQKKFEQTWKQDHRMLEKWAKNLEASLKSQGIAVRSVELQRRHFRDVRSLSVEQEDMLQHVESFHAVTVVVRNSVDCFCALGGLHRFATPVPAGIDDYISSPKVNGYQALHSVVITPSGNPITLILQTEDMRRQAQFGMALLYREKQKRWHTSVPDWLEALLTLDENEQDLRAFFQRVQTEIFGERSRVQMILKQKKRAVDLPAYASILDVAFYAGMDIGSSIARAAVNGKPASLKQLVHDGDTVEAFPDTVKQPRDAQDLYFIHTALGHKHLVTHLAGLPKSERIRRGEHLLQNALNFTMDPFFSIGWQKQVGKHIPRRTDLLEKIGCGMIDAFLFVEEHGKPEDFFLLDPACFHLPTGLQTPHSMHYVLRASLEDLRRGEVVGLQSGPDVVDVVSVSELKHPRKKLFSREIISLQIREDCMDFPFLFAIRWTFPYEANPLKDIAALESFLDTPVRLLQFAPGSVTLGFRTDALRTLQFGYKYLRSLPHVTELFRITPG